MAKNKIEDLRNHLFAQLERLGDDDINADRAKRAKELDRAKAVADVARVVIESAKAETHFLEVTGKTEGTGFMPTPEVAGAPQRPRLAAGGR